jgi:hypothetical protein
MYLLHREALVSPRLWDQPTKIYGVTHETINGLQTLHYSSNLTYIGNIAFNVNLISDDTFGNKPRERLHIRISFTDRLTTVIIKLLNFNA